jgi:hypothetical protein
MLVQSVYGLPEPEAEVSSLLGTQSFSNFSTSETTIRRPKLPEKLRESRSLKIADQAGLTVRSCIVVEIQCTGDLIHDGRSGMKTGMPQV